MEIKRSIIVVATLFLVLIGIFYFFRPNPVKNFPSSGRDIIAFGDSLVQGVGSSKSGDFVSVLSKRIGLPIVNLGHSGDTTEDGLVRINDLDNFNPKVVLLLLGGNDYLKKVPIVETERNLSKLIENIQARGSVVILLGVRGGLINDKFERMFQGLSNKYNTAYVKNVLSGLLLNTNYMSDAIHPNNTGYAFIADRIEPVLRDMIK